MARQRIDEIRGLPLQRRTYLVPTVKYRWAGRMFTWPVLTPMHTDPELDFDVLHWNIDARFTSADMEQHCLSVVRKMGGGDQYDELGLSQQGQGVDAAATIALTHDPEYGPMPKVPTWLPLVCQRSRFDRVWRCPTITAKVQSQFPWPATPRTSNGRIFCPHRGADLTTLMPDADGFVRCPMHQLLVQVRHG